MSAAAELEPRRQELVRRLDEGYTRLDQALLAGEDVASWEAFWIDLLGEYEQLSAEMDAATEDSR